MARQTNNAHAHTHTYSRVGWRRRLLSTNHSDIGTMYLALAVVGGLIGGLSSVLIRMELMVPGVQFMLTDGAPDGQLWNVTITAHGLIMVFFMIVPAMIGGFGNWMVPLMIGASDVAFPRLNLLSFWLLCAALIAFLAAVMTGQGVGTDWTIYRNLSSDVEHPGPPVNMAMLALVLAGTSAIFSAINFITTIFNMRAPEVNLHGMPLFVWAILMTGFTLLLSLPVLAGAITMLANNYDFDSLFIKVDGGGDPGSFQNVFWFFGHPQVYVMMLPGFGIIAQVIATFIRKPVFGYPVVVYSLVAIAFLGFIVWAHHMYTLGLGADPKAYLTTASLLVAVPTAIIICSLIATMWGRSVKLTTPMLFAVGFIFLFATGGVTGLMLAGAGIDVVLRDTYYVVAHFHYVLSSAAIFAIFAAFYYWFGRMCGRQYNEVYGRIHFGITFLGVNLTFFPQHFLGLAGMLRRVVDYPNVFTSWNFISSVGAYVSVAGGLFFFFIIWDTVRRGQTVVGNYWGDGATSLEWTVVPPPPLLGKEEVPATSPIGL